MQELVMGREGRTRSVEEILARREREVARRRMELAPDFLHGQAQLAECYDVFGATWAERALFVVEGQGVCTVAYFNDYFLVVEQWSAASPGTYGDWLAEKREIRDRVIRWGHGQEVDEEREGEIRLDITAQQLQHWEREVLGLVRDGSEGDVFQKGQVDVLTLVTLTARLSLSH